MIPGLSGTHRWNDEITLNDLTVWPRYRLRRIPGLHTRPDLEDARDQPAGRRGEVPRRALQRGRSIVYEGRIEALSFVELEQARDDLLAAFADPDGRMDVASRLDEAAYRPDPSQPPDTPPVNLATNPSFEKDTATYFSAAGVGTILFDGREHAVSPGAAGEWSYRQAITLNDTGGKEPLLCRLPVVPGTTYSFGWLIDLLQRPTGTSQLRYYWLTAGFAAIGGAMAVGLSGTGPGVKTPTIEGVVAPPGAAWIQIGVRTNAGVAGEIWEARYDDLILVQGATLPEYFDGDSPGCEWSGEPHASTSIGVVDNPQTPVRSYFYGARCLAADVPEEHPDAVALRRATRGYERNFTISLRLADPRYYTSPSKTGQTAAVTPQSGRPLPWRLPVSIPAPGTASGTVEVTNDGTAPADPIFDLWGPAPQPAMLNDTLDVELGLTLQIPAGQFVRVDFRDRSVLLNGLEDVRRSIDPDRASWWEGDEIGLRKGPNALRYVAAGLQDPAHATVTFDEAWWS